MAKDVEIRFRVTREMQLFVKRAAKRQKQTVNEFMRDMLRLRILREKVISEKSIK